MIMNSFSSQKRVLISALAMIGAVGIVAGCTSMSGSMSDSMYTQTVTLSGANEVPPVTTSASGTATVTIKPDHSVSVKESVSGMTATASHIHQGAAGANGPVIVPFTKTADNTFAAADGAKLTDAQYEAFKAGNLYVNVHSAAHPGGEIRAQLKPQ
jgi:CHRD domain-containing protein